MRPPAAQARRRVQAVPGRSRQARARRGRGQGPQARPVLRRGRQPRHGGLHAEHLRGGPQGPAGHDRVPPRQPPARLPGVRQGRRVPAAESGTLGRAGELAVRRRQAHLPQARRGLLPDPPGPRPVHSVPAVHALPVADRRRPLHRPPGPGRRQPPLRGPLAQRLADRKLRRAGPELLRLRRRQPRGGGVALRRLPRGAGHGRGIRHGPARARRDGRVGQAVLLLLLRERHPDLPRRGPDERRLSLPLPPLRPRLRARGDRARRLRIGDPRRLPARRGPAPPGRRGPGRQRRVDHRQGPLRLPMGQRGRPPHAPACARRVRRARADVVGRRPRRRGPGAGPRVPGEGRRGPDRRTADHGGRLRLLEVRARRPGDQRHRLPHPPAERRGGRLPRLDGRGGRPRRDLRRPDGRARARRRLRGRGGVRQRLPAPAQGRAGRDGRGLGRRALRHPGDGEDAGASHPRGPRAGGRRPRRPGPGGPHLRRAGREGGRPRRRARQRGAGRSLGRRAAGCAHGRAPGLDPSPRRRQGRSRHGRHGRSAAGRPPGGRPGGARRRRSRVGRTRPRDPRPVRAGHPRRRRRGRALRPADRRRRTRRPPRRRPGRRRGGGLRRPTGGARQRGRRTRRRRPPRGPAGREGRVVRQLGGPHPAVRPGAHLGAAPRSDRPRRLGEGDGHGPRLGHLGRRRRPDPRIPGVVRGAARRPGPPRRPGQARRAGARLGWFG